jgi:hypothetical protein
MSAPPSLPRRWLLGAVAGGVMALKSAIPHSAPRSEDARERVRRKLVSLLHNPQRARQVGAVYLQSPLEQPAAPLALAEAVLAAVGPNAGSEAIRGYVVARIRQELQEVQVISLDGWIMSPTEAQLCALAAAGGSP